MSITIGRLQSWLPDQLEAAANGLIRDRTTLIDLQDELDAGRPPLDWRGDDATAARATYQTLRERINDFVAPLSRMVAAIDDAAAKIRTAQADLSEAQGLIEARGWQLTVIGRDVTVTDPSEPDPDDDSTRATYAGLVATALSDAMAADNDLDRFMLYAQVGVYDGGQSTMLDASLPPGWQSMNDRELADFFVANPELTDTYLGALTPFQQELVGESLAELASGLTVDEETFTYGADGFGLPEENRMAALTQALTAFDGSPVVSTSFLNALGPEEFLRLQASYVANGTEFDPAMIGEAQTSMSTMLSGATQGTLPGSNGSQTSVSDAWLQEFIGHGLTDFDTGHSSWMNGFQLMSPLVGEPGHSTYFLTETGDALDAADRETPHGLAWAHATDDGEIDFTDGAGDNTVWGNDPLAALMEGLSHNPEASQQFFTADLPTGDGEVSRIQWYASDREWPSMDNWGLPINSGVEHVGEALDAGINQDPTARSTRMLEELVSATGHSDHPFHPELAEPMADIIAPHMQDVFDSYLDEQMSQPLSRPESEGASFETDTLTGFLEQIGRDPEAQTTVDDAAANYATSEYQAYFNGTGAESGTYAPGEGLDEMAQDANSYVTNPWTSVMGALGQGSVDVRYEDAVAADELADSIYDARTGAITFLAGTAVGATPMGELGEIAVDVVSAPIVEHFRPEPTAPAETQAAMAGYAETVAAQAMRAEAAVYAGMPVQSLPSELVVNGQPVPPSQWTEAQATAWLESDYSVSEAIMAAYDENVDNPLPGNGDEG